MEETDFCPYCDELVKLNFTEDYHEVKQEEQFDICKCPNCKKEVGIAWRVEHEFFFKEV